MRLKDRGAYGRRPMPPSSVRVSPERYLKSELASSDFKYLSGETLTLEGGMGLRP